MPNPASADAPLSLVLCVDDAGVAALPARLDRLHAALADIDHEVVLVGHGTPDVVAPALRRAATRPHHRTLLHAHRCPAAEALVEGVAMAQTPWVLALATTGDLHEGQRCRELWRLAQLPAESAVCLRAGADQPILFLRGAFLALAPIARMRDYLPELFARAGAPVRDVAAAPARRAMPFARWLRRTRVALLCRMAAMGNTARA
jgi:hypothetical protein